MLPSLVKLSTYPDSDRAWVDREDLVLGGCKPGTTQEESECYGGWNAAFLARVLENPQANTIVMLSVGAGVLELRSIETAIAMRGDGDRAIDRVWLIDPFIDPETGNQVASQYAARLEGVDVTYFTGDWEAYDKALRLLITSSPRVTVATIGALNTSFGALSPHPAVIALHNAMLRFVRRAAQDRMDAPLYVVQAWYNAQQGHVVMDEPADDFLARRGREMEAFAQLIEILRQ